MKLIPFSDESIDMIDWISNDNTTNCIPSPKWNEKTSNVVGQLFNDIIRANDYVQKEKREKGLGFYNVDIQLIAQRKELPVPDTFNMNSIPEGIKSYIEAESSCYLSYKTQINGKSLNVNFILNSMDPFSHVGIFNKYFDRIVTWMHIANRYASNKCGKDLTVFLYLTPFKKELPKTQLDIIGQEHANTAFTYTCPNKTSEIVIFREEEWFKVFIHETFHNLSLDFSCLDVKNMCSKIMKNIFPIESDFLLFEAYTEAWSVIINTCLCTYFCFDHTKTLDPFTQTLKFLLGFECLFKIFQMNKILQFMGLDYSLLYSMSSRSKKARETLYKEDTNIFAYHVATTILLCNYPMFIEWCDTNNMHAMLFKKTPANVESFCEFISKKHNSDYTLRVINNVDKKNGCYGKMIKNGRKADLNIDKTMRMTICEMS